MGADLNAGDILQENYAAVRITPQHDISEFLRGLQPSLNVQFVIHILIAVFRADGTCRRLNVLFFDGRGDVRRREIQSRHAQRIEPDAHGVFFRRHQIRRRYAFQPGDGIFHIRIDIVVQFRQIHACAVGQKCEHRQNIVAPLFHGDSGLGDFGGQLRLRPFDRILQIDHCDVRVGSAAESHGACIVAVVAAGRGEVQQVVNAVDLVFQGNCHGLHDHIRTCSGIGCGNINLRWRDLRVFRHRQPGERNDAGQHHDDADDQRKTGMFDEES